MVRSDKRKRVGYGWRVGHADATVSPAGRGRSRRSRYRIAPIAKVVLVVALIGGCVAYNSWMDSRQHSPEALRRRAGDACIALADDDREVPKPGLLDRAEEPDVVAIHDYLENYEQGRKALAETGDIGVIDGYVAVGQGLLEGAAEACSRLGHPELQERLAARDSEDGGSDIAP